MVSHVYKEYLEQHTCSRLGPSPAAEQQDLKTRKKKILHPKPKVLLLSVLKRST